jgi:hypothetical protein
MYNNQNLEMIVKRTHLSSSVSFLQINYCQNFSPYVNLEVFFFFFGGYFQPTNNQSIKNNI